MSNYNKIEAARILAFVADYAELCRKHNLYLVHEEDVWLQEGGDQHDLDDVEPNMLERLIT